MDVLQQRRRAVTVREPAVIGRKPPLIRRLFLAEKPDDHLGVLSIKKLSLHVHRLNTCEPFVGPPVDQKILRRCRLEDETKKGSEPMNGEYETHVSWLDQ